MSGFFLGLVDETTCQPVLDVVQYRPLGKFSDHEAFFHGGQHMSKVVTPPGTQPMSPTPFKIPHEKIAQRAYEKWVKRGRPHGQDRQDWLEAEAELRVEYARGSTGAMPARR
jgi:hypothetical protein